MLGDGIDRDLLQRPSFCPLRRHQGNSGGVRAQMRAHSLLVSTVLRRAVSAKRVFALQLTARYGSRRCPASVHGPRVTDSVRHPRVPLSGRSLLSRKAHKCACPQLRMRLCACYGRGGCDGAGVGGPTPNVARHVNDRSPHRPYAPPAARSAIKGVRRLAFMAHRQRKCHLRRG